MDEIALHILDIAMNAVGAGARRVTITVRENPEADRLEVCLADDGRGMDASRLQAVLRNFASEKAGRRRPLGLGLALLAQTAEQCAGEMHITSTPGEGTRVEAWMRYRHIDRPPLGDLNETLFSLCVGVPELDVEFSHQRNGVVGRFDSAAVRTALGPEASLQSPEGMRAVRQALCALERLIQSA